MVVAIDGYSSCGKSTLAKELATNLNYLYIDSGAMYRAVTKYLLDNNISLDNPEVCHAIQKIKLEFRWNKDHGQNELWMNNVNVDNEIRNLTIASQVSEVATIKCVRDYLVSLQQEYGKSNSVVMDGRDIGTVVFPDADLKVFVIADIDTRVQRRYDELIENNQDSSEEEVRQNLIKRDYIDSNREISPLRQAKDAVVLDNTNLSKEEQLKTVTEWVKQRESGN